MQGNIIFEGDSKKKENIYYTVDFSSFFQNKKGNVLDKNGRSGKWFVKNGFVYYESFEENNNVLIVEETSEYLAFYNPVDDSLLAYIPLPTSYSSATIFALVQIVWHRFDLKEAYENRTKISSSTANETGFVGILEPILGIGDVWAWDGTYVFPLYNRDNYLKWKYSNGELKPVLAPRTTEEWRWDGETLEPLWGGHPRNNWTWRNNTISRIWQNDFGSNYIYDNGIIRKRFGNFGDTEWQVVGTMPKPVIIAIILGILYR